MARDPGSTWKPLPEAGPPDGRTKTQLIVHSTGTLASAAANWGYFARGDIAVESTFIVGQSSADPTLQIMDSTDVADANGSANSRGISVEVVGDGVGGYTAWQVAELVRIGRWARATHGIPPRIIPSHTEGGFGWHVMFGAPGPWTSVVGKVCPGRLRIAQLQTTVFPAIFLNTSAGRPAPTSSPAPAPEDPLVKNLILARDMTTDPKITKVYVGDGITRRFIPDNQALKDIQWWIARKGGDPTVHEFANIWVLGDLAS